VTKGVLQGRVAVVTGASRGIGREIAQALAAEGMHLALVARTGAQVREVAEQIQTQYGGNVLPASLDVRSPEAVERFARLVEQQLGPVDLLVNNAGRIEPAERPFWEADPAQMWEVVETNLRGPLLLTRALIAPMVQRGHGHVVNIASLARGATKTGTYTGYAVSKRALTVLTESLGAALEGTGVVVIDVLPGRVRTAMSESMPVWRDLQPEDWDPVEATTSVVVAVACGEYDDRAGSLLDAPALHSGS